MFATLNKNIQNGENKIIYFINCLGISLLKSM